VPNLYTCHGKDISPPLQWSDPPQGTQSFVLIMDDVDAPAGVWDHWILYNIPPSTKALAEDIKKLPEGTLQGKNSWGNIGYRGPCPPTGKEHRYFFRLYALNSLLSLPSGADKKQVLELIPQHLLEKTELMVKYKQ
jgi:Raf kinase inhibitor-like YbhB/YbcL family protein